MKYAEPRPYADPEAAQSKLSEIRQYAADHLVSRARFKATISSFVAKPRFGQLRELT